MQYYTYPPAILLHESEKTLTVAGVSGGDLGQVSVVIALHLQVEDFALGIAGFGDQVLVQQTLQRKNCILKIKKSINQSSTSILNQSVKRKISINN